jgi:hypothetical protein
MAYGGPARTEEKPRRTGPRLAPVADDGVRWGGVALFAAGVTLGISLGASLALLYAPDTGRKTRSRLRRGGRMAVRRSRDAWDDLRYELKSAVRRRRRAAAIAGRDDHDD